MSKIRKVFTISVMLVTVLSMSVVVVPEVNAAASAGDLIKMDGLSSVYYLGADGKRYVFPNEQTYFSWYSDWSGVVTIPQSELETYPLAANVTIRPGTKLVKITTNPTVYSVEANGTLRSIVSESNAAALWGANWAKRVVDVPDSFFTNYTVGTALTAGAYPAGSLVKYGTSADVYYINADGTASKFSGEAAFTGNRLKWADVITSTSAVPTLGTEIATATMIDTSQGGGTGVGITPGAGTGLTVALASDTPASATTLTDSTAADGGQALIPVTKVNFTAASDGAVKVTSLKFKRGGVPSADTDFAEFYLYDGTTLLAKYSSISSGVLTFTNASGLFTVAAGTTKAVTLKVNLDQDCLTSRAYIFSILAAADITTDGATVSGSFPINGNLMSTAAVADLGKFTVKHSGADSSAPDPGVTNHTLWKFTAAATDQDINIERLKFTVIGTADVNDLANFTLEVGGVQIGSKVAAMASDKTITFDFETPYKIAKGNTKIVSLKGDVVGGTSRTYQVYFYNKEDLVVKDVEYGVYVTPNQDDTWKKINAANPTTINAGSLTVSKNINSPSDNVATGATNVTIGKFDFKAIGEAIKVDTVYVYSTASLYQVKLYVDGSQVGTAVNLATTTATSVSLGNSFIIPAGTTKTLEVKSDIKDSTSSSINKTNNTSIAFQLGNVNSCDYTKQTSGGTDHSGAVSGNALTAKTGTLTAAENTSFGDRSSSIPTGVVNATGVKIASFTLTAGAGEGVTITQISLYDYDAATLMGTNFQNLVLKHGATQLGNTIGNLNATAVGTYDFSPSPAISLNAGEQYVVDVYADIKSSATQTEMNMHGIKFASVTATGNTTSTDASYDPTDFELQTMYIASVGNLYISDDADTPVAQQLVMGAADQEVARFKLEASASENLDVTQLVISDSVSSVATGTLQNIKIYDGTTLIAGPVQLDTTNATTTYAHAVFSGFTLTIPANGNKIITVKADVSPASAGAVSGSTHTIKMLVDNGITATETVTVKGAQSGTVLTTAADTIDYYSSTDPTTDVDQEGNAMTVYRTKVTAAWASDSPSGASVGSSAETIAKINITNSANAGNYTAIIKYVNLALSTTISNTANRAMNVYKDNLNTTSLGATSWLAAENRNFSNSEYTDAGLTNVEIAAGATKLFLFTLDTTDGNTAGDFSLSVNMEAGDIGWDDSAGTTITTCNSLPLISKTLTY